MKQPISFADYARMHRVISTVLKQMNMNGARACTYFAIAGAIMISNTLKLKAKPRFGAAFFLVDEKSKTTLAFTDIEAFEHNEIDSNQNAFHAWIECNGVIIDLLAPIFHESVQSQQPGHPAKIPRKMFQKPVSAMVDLANFSQDGDFFLHENGQLSEQMLFGFARDSANLSFVQLCMNWFRPSPKAMKSTLDVHYGDGVPLQMKLEQTALSGRW